MEGGENKKSRRGGGENDPATGTGTQPGQGQGGDGDRASEVGGGQASSSTTPADGGEDLERGSPSGNEDGEVEVEDGIHPLMDQVILGHLFTFMPPRALATSRLVCRTWRDLSLSTWRSRTTVRICRLGLEDESEYYLRGEERTTLGQFMDFWDANCLIKPYRQFRLERWTFQEGNVGAGGGGAGVAADLARFWQGVGSQMTKLIMDFSSTDLEQLVKVIIHSCPNLKTLILQDLTLAIPIRNNVDARVVAAADDDDDDDDYDYHEDPVLVSNPKHIYGVHQNLRSLRLIFFPDHSIRRGRMNYTWLLSHFPHLTSIQVGGEGSRQHTEGLLLLRAVKEVRTQGPHKLPLRELITDRPLDLSSELLPDNDIDENEVEEDEEIMRLLLELRIPAHSLRLIASELSQIDFQNIIESSAETLTELVVFLNSSPRCEFPFGLHLEKLRHLTMSEGFCRTLELLKDTPNLETLCIQDDATISLSVQESSIPDPVGPRGMETDLISNTFKPDLEDVLLFKLSTLTIEFVVRDYDLRWLVRWMPQVKNLSMFLDDRQFAIVCENWGELVALTVLGNRLTDAGVTGMIEVRGNRSGSKMRVVHPNVTFLQKLKFFTARKSTLTSASLYHGILKLDLRQIGFQKAEKMEVAAKEALLQKNIILIP